MKYSILLAILSLAVGQASAAILTFDEVVTQPADGLTVSGVTFAFEIGGAGSDLALYNSELLLPTTFLDDRVLSGPIGAVRFSFLIPVTFLSFGVALNTFDSMAPGVSVELFDSSLQSLGTSLVNTDGLVSVSEAQFVYSGTPIQSGLVTFTDNTVVTLFAIDNLEFDVSQTAVPEPGSFALLSVGALLLVAARRRWR